MTIPQPLNEPAASISTPNGGSFTAPQEPHSISSVALGVAATPKVQPFFDWYEDRAGVLICGRCYENTPFKVRYTAVPSPLPDLTEDCYCESCGSHPCRWCGEGIVPAGFKYCQKHSHFCPVCDGGGEIGGDPNYESPETCPDCGGKGRALCRICKTRRAEQGCSGYCSRCEERVEEASRGLA